MAENTFFDFVWKIENFAFCLQKRGEELLSPTFTMDSSDKGGFYITLMPRGDAVEDSIAVYLNKVKGSGPDISLLFDISVLNFQGEALESIHDLEYDYIENGGYGFGNDIALRENVILEKTRQFLPQGTLTVRCRIRKYNGKMVEAGQCIARTHIGVEHRAFNWIIDGILDLNQNSMTVDSAENKYPSVTMRLSLKPCLSSDGPLRLEIIQLNSTKNYLLVCKISLLNDKGDVVLCAKDEHLFEKNTRDQIWDFPLLITKSHLIRRKNSLLPGGILTFRCEYTMSVGPPVLEMIECLTYGPPSLRMINSSIDEPCGVNRPDTLPKCSALKNDIQNLYENKQLCDVSLKTDGESFSAHKAILSSRSPVFKAMFTSDMKENATGSVCISDIDADSMKQMLSFMYTDAIDDLDVEAALKLYFAADKYQIESLKELCSSYLSDHLQQSNVCEVLILADVHKDHRLKINAEEFIFFNEGEIMRSENWKDLMKINLELAAEVLHHLCLKKT